MIVYEAAASPSVRAGEGVLAGRRVAGRLAPYGAEALVLRFDPLERRFLFPREEPLARPGPVLPEGWREAVSRLPPGPVLVGPPAEADAEAVWGSGRAAVEAAIGSGRGVYLLDPEPEAVPDDAGSAVVILCSWRPGAPARAFPTLDRFRDSALQCAAVFPLIPGWTAEEEPIEALAEAASRGVAASLTAFVPAADGEGRRAIVAARSRYEPGEEDRFFEVIHHGDWPERLAAGVAAARRAAAAKGLRPVPPRPAGRGQPRGNREAAARLEQRGELSEMGEHRAALLYAAVRWIDESPHDLSAVAREGNFRKVFPFEGEIAEWAEAALVPIPLPVETGR
jgi:hypothetical protein